MTVAELIKLLSDYDQSAIVAVKTAEINHSWGGFAEVSDITAMDVLVADDSYRLKQAMLHQVESGETASCVVLS